MRRPLAAMRDLRTREEFVTLGRRTRDTVLVAGVTGVLTGLAVAGFEHLTAEVLLAGVLEAPLWVQAASPAAGLLISFLALRWLAGGATPSNTDEYIRNYHEPGRRLDTRPVIGRMVASVGTLGFGGSLGYEGPSIYAGASIGSVLQRRFARFFGPREAKVLLVAGAAAGVAAIFKAPVTGLVFALEVPYQEDLARRMLLPAAISSAASYLTFVALTGTEPLLPVAGEPPFNLVDLGGAAVVGLAAGLLARAFVVLVRVAKSLAGRGNPAIRIAASGAAMAACFAAGHALAAERNLTLGPGYDAIRWVLLPEHALWVVVAAGTLRVAATTATLAGGGTGGLFIPLVVQGAFVGRAISGVFGSANATLFPLVGIAAFLGAGYRVPLAAVVFVAEVTGRPGFVVPGLIAGVVSQLVMGRSSISPYQVAGRVGHLEGRLRLPLATLIEADVRTVPPDATVEEFFWQHLVGTRRQSVAVVDDEDRYLGLASADGLGGLDRELWAQTPVADILRADLPVADPHWTVGDAIRAMESADIELLAVCDGERFVGVVAARDLVALDQILDRTQPET